MHRRQILSVLGTVALAPLFAPLSLRERWTAGTDLHARAARQAGGRALSPAQWALVTALADTIIPRTGTPGAVDVGSPAFVDLLLAEWYPDQERQDILTGIDAWDARCREAQGNTFAALDETSRIAYLTLVDAETGPAGSPAAAYAAIKSGIVFGYVTSKQVAEAERTMPIIPGRFDGCVPMGGGG
jgi:gluconate 2-dehydrogenase gamma chain